MSESVEERHFWALMQGKLVVVVGGMSGDFSVCGGWAGSVGADELTLIEEIQKPPGHESTEIYYSE